MSHSSQTDEHPSSQDGLVHSHIGSLAGSIGIFVTLVALTILTVGISDVHLGKANLVVAIVIASMKASLVLLFFMHLRYDNKFHGMIIVVSMLFIGVFFAYTMNDTNRRGEVDLSQGVKVNPANGEVAPGASRRKSDPRREAPRESLMEVAGKLARPARPPDRPHHVTVRPPPNLEAPATKLRRIRRSCNVGASSKVPGG